MIYGIPSRSTTCGSWFAAGEDVGALLPVLQTYLGHSLDRRHRLLPAADRRVLPGHHRPGPARVSATSSRPSPQGRAMATDFAVVPAPLPHRPPGRAARLLTQHGRVLPRHVQAPDRLLPRRADPSRRRSSPSTASTPPPSPGSSTGSRPAGTTASSTRNQRLAAISSFYRWMQTQDPARMACCQDILAIPAKKQTAPGRQPPHRRADPRPARRSPTGPPGRAAATRPCSPPSTTPPPGSRNSPTSPSATSASNAPPWPP